ncbi:hypothetical protein QTN47_18415 [Danxiaibacter flavus]|uniref:Porin n=1 Tax=Danxiaibacter flavus TaxID=3049108 RepID=A0ABV3ZI43_9BACT|nr:hypothetical protein QNM32_18425 [Chitinophagaceae bacterium DXS]
MTRNIFLATCLILLVSLQTFGQYTADKVIGQKNVDVIDSLKTADYPYLLPIWGKKVAQKGFKLPKSAGLSIQYLTQKSDITINNLKVGVNNGPLHDLDQIVRFDGARTTSNGVNIRPDFWIFPFLNVYAIFAKSRTSTAVDCGVWLPDDSSWKRVASFSSKANFDATTFGFGLTPTVGVGGFFIILDMNCTWSDISALDKPAFAFVFGPRIGKNITFKNHPEKSVTVWAGGFRLKINTGTTGSLNASDLLPVNEWQSKIDTGYMKVSQNQQKVDNWWAGLTTVEQKNPVNVARHEAANAALAKAGNVLDQASQIVSGAGNATIQYSLDKKPQDPWNFIIGSQFQINRSWMIRAEYGFLGSRSQFIGGLQYRFNL